MINFFLLPFMLILPLYFYFSHNKWRFEKGNIQENRSIEGSFAQLSYGRVHYTLRGPEDGELVVFIHGISMPSEPYLIGGIDEYYVKEGYRFLTFDLYGRGYSDCPDTNNTPQLFAGQLAELLYFLDIKESFYLIGNSMGGGVASYFTRIYPSRVKKLVLLSSVGFPVTANSLFPVMKIPVLGEVLFKTIAPHILIQSTRSLQTESIVLKVAVKHCSEKDGLFRSVYSTLLYFPLGNMNDTFVEIAQQPIKVLIIHGDNDDTIPYTSAIEISKALPNSSLYKVIGGKHNVTLENKHEVHSKVIAFINSK